MSKSGKTHVVASVDSGVVVGGEKHSRRHAHLKAGVLVAACVVAAVCVVVVVLIIRRPDKTSAPVVTASDLASIETNANQAATQHGPQAGLAVYMRAASGASNRSVQGAVYTQAADLALDNNMKSEALTYALDADNDLHTATTSDVVAVIYRSEGDNGQAVTYFKKAAAEAPATSKAPESGRSFYLMQAQQAEEAE